MNASMSGYNLNAGPAECLRIGIEHYESRLPSYELDSAPTASVLTSWLETSGCYASEASIEAALSEPTLARALKSLGVDLADYGR